ncbi:hypothetical protein D3C72_2404960 [compost metagenome]
MAVERRDDVGVIGNAKRRHIGGRDLQIGRHAHFRNGNDGAFDQIVADFTALENLGQGGAHLFANTQHALRRGR